MRQLISKLLMVWSRLSPSPPASQFCSCNFPDAVSASCPATCCAAASAVYAAAVSSGLSISTVSASFHIIYYTIYVSGGLIYVALMRLSWRGTSQLDTV